VQIILVQIVLRLESHLGERILVLVGISKDELRGAANAHGRELRRFLAQSKPLRRQKLLGAGEGKSAHVIIILLPVNATLISTVNNTTNTLSTSITIVECAILVEVKLIEYSMRFKSQVKLSSYYLL
jgi:hypothetical protein